MLSQSWKSDNYMESNTEIKPWKYLQKPYKKGAKRLNFCSRKVGRVNTIWGAIEKWVTKNKLPFFWFLYDNRVVKIFIYRLFSLENKYSKSSHLKMAYWIIRLSNSLFIKYCDSNIKLFSFASYKVIALPTIATAIVVALTRS